MQRLGVRNTQVLNTQLGRVTRYIIWWQRAGFCLTATIERMERILKRMKGDAESSLTAEGGQPKMTSQESGYATQRTDKQPAGMSADVPIN